MSKIVDAFKKAGEAAAVAGNAIKNFTKAVTMSQADRELWARTKDQTVYISGNFMKVKGKKAAKPYVPADQRPAHKRKRNVPKVAKRNRRAGHHARRRKA